MANIYVLIVSFLATMTCLFMIENGRIVSQANQIVFDIKNAYDQSIEVRGIHFHTKDGAFELGTSYDQRIEVREHDKPG